MQLKKKAFFDNSLSFRDGSLSYHSNLFTGILGVFIFFMVISALTFPNGPFVRPHPMFWRMTFGLSVMYLMLLQFLIHQDYATVKALIEWYDPKMANYSIDAEKVRSMNHLHSKVPVAYFS